MNKTKHVVYPLLTRKERLENWLDGRSTIWWWWVVAAIVLAYLMFDGMEL